MRNILLKLCFDGTAYHGWQVQENADTVQQRVEDAIFALTGERLRVEGCSRTDAGVHAREFYCTARLMSPFTLERLPVAMNAHLPRDIAVLSCMETPDSFHPRYDAVEKRYSYRIWNERTRNPFLERYALHYPYGIDFDRLKAAAGCFVGRMDFRGFMAAGSTIKDTVRTVLRFDVEKEENLITLNVTGDGFLYNMVRIMVGTLLYVAQGKIGLSDLPGVIASCDRKMGGPTAPPQGLSLDRVIYREKDLCREK